MSNEPQPSFPVVFTSHFSHPYKDCVTRAPKHLPRIRTKSPAQQRPLASALYPQTTVHRHSPRKPDRSFDRTQAPHKGKSLHGEARPMSPTSCRVGSGGEVVGPLGGGLLGVVLFPSPLTPPFRGAAFFPHPLGGAAFSDLPLSVVQFSLVLLFGGVPSPAPFGWCFPSSCWVVKTKTAKHPTHRRLDA